MLNKIFKTSLMALVLGFLFSPSVFADEYIISGNGSGSDNTIEVTSSSSTSINQTNTATVDNAVNQTASTGSNNVSSNTGDASITTGSAQSGTSVVNQDINSNSATNNPCNCVDNPLSINISGNGANSVNNAGLAMINNQTAIQSNSAQIVNDIYNKANTGYNSANYNNGDVIINTGNALALATIKNKNINLSTVSFGGPDGLISLLINGNGAGSINLIKLIFDNSTTYENKNIAVIYNNVANEADTGHNTASNNNGSVLIATGNAVSIVDIANENINGSSAELCACKVTPPPGNGGENPPPATPPSSGGNGGSSISQSAGQVLGAALGSILPATGGYWMLLLTLLCLTLFLAGGYLRFGSGISPPFSYAV